MPASSPSFSLTRRYAAGRALSAYVQGEVRAGRPLVDVLDDARVREALAGMPELFEDLTDDRELRELLAAPRDAPVVLVGYDGSRAARGAVERAARTLPEARALVVTVWEEGERDEARERAEEGAALARALGLDAEPLAARRDRDTWSTLARCALLFEADLAVVGTRARPCTRALAEESVAHRAISEDRLPVLVVPDRMAAPLAPAVGRERREPARVPEDRLAGMA